MSGEVNTPELITFTAGAEGSWIVDRMSAIRGARLAPARRLAIVPGRNVPPAKNAAWVLRGVISHLRYTTAHEAKALAAQQPALGREEATRAALIPIRKSARWWAAPQDERRAIYEERSRHTTVGLEYLPRIARRLHHSRELGEPFDFLTWFEFSPEHEPAFDDLVGRLRTSEEWDYVEREIDIRLTRAKE